MTLEDKVKDRIHLAPIGSDEKNFLRTILGELSLKKGKDGLHVIRDLLRTNEDSMRRCRRNPDELERIELENQVLKSLLEAV